jgi:hypothetical protein
MPDRVLIERLLRNFPENGVKVMLENPANVRDVLNLLGVRCVGRIDFGRMEVDPTHFVGADYRHLAADLVLRAPLRALGRGRVRWLTIYVLIEHQSEPDPFMPFRVLEYVIQVYKRQMTQWQAEHGSLDSFRFQPVLPVVLYTGTRTWERVPRLSEILALDEDLKDLAPEFAPLFLNVSQASGEDLEERGGAFGLLLRLVQQRRARRRMFEETLKRVVRALEDELASSDRDRWLALLSYVAALIYHDREKDEREPMRRLVEDSVQNDARRLEVYDMGQTIAEALREEGRAEEAVRSRQETLLRVLRIRFRKVPSGVEQRITNTDSPDQLDTWIDAFAKAKKLSDVGIPPMEG